MAFFENHCVLPSCVSTLLLFLLGKQTLLDAMSPVPVERRPVPWIHSLEYSRLIAIVQNSWILHS